MYQSAIMLLFVSACHAGRLADNPTPVGSANMPKVLLELCKQRMANAKYSRRIEIKEESPKTAIGKFRLREVRD